MKVLINDGISESGLVLLRQAGYDVHTDHIPQDQLIQKLHEYDAICVRSATKVRKDLIDQCPRLKAIGRGGVGLDNIDVEYAKEKGIQVLNTPAASSRSVAELVFAHMLSTARSVYQSNRKMPSEGHTNFKSLKKSFSKGTELEGKVLGVIGMGRIGQETMKIGIGMGMEILGVDPYVDNVSITIGNKTQSLEFNISSVPLEDMLSKADFISLHIPSLGKPILLDEEFSQMKEGVIIINCSRGGTIDEDALLNALNKGHVSYAGLDVFENEPMPREDILNHPKISLTPHIGASTVEAQDKIGIELAEKVIQVLG